jgi:hypothetical protein
VEATVSRFLKLSQAFRAHLEPGHGGFGAVVWDVLDDAKARAAIGAIDERVPIPAVIRVKQLPLAFRTY